MLYQNLLIGIEPYSVTHDVGKDFPQHVHYELELILVTEGMTLSVEYSDTDHARIRAIAKWSEKAE